MINENADASASHMTPMNDLWECCEKTFAELRIYPGDLKPSTVSDILHLKPTHFVDVGEPIIGTRAIGRINGWFLSSEAFVHSRDLRAHLDWLLLALRDSVDELRRLQRMMGVRMYVYCSWWSRCGECGPTLWPAQMEKLVLLNLECSFSFIYTGEDKP